MSYVHTGWGAFFFSLGCLLIVLEAARRAGESFLIGRFQWEGQTALERALFSAGIGLVFFAMGFYAVGSLIGLSRWTVLIYTTIFVAASVAAGGVRDRPALIRVKRLSWRSVVLAIPMLLSLWSCGKPPTGNDALAYHLAYPRIFLESGRIAPIAWTRESLWPFMTEMFYTFALSLQGTTLAQMFHWVFYPLTALAVYAWVRRADARMAYPAAWFFAYTPAVFAQASDAYVDLSIAFFLFLAFYAFTLDREEGSHLWPALSSGLFCGAALSVKYLAIGCSAALAVLWMVRSARRPAKIALFALSAACVCSVWYVRSWVVLGNPVYPFLGGIFGGNGFDFGIDRGVGMGKGLTAWMGLPWNLAMNPAAFGGPVLGPAFVLFGPVGLWAIRKAPKAMSLLWMGLSGALFIFLQAQQARFFLSILPFACVVAAWGYGRMRQWRGPARTAAALCLSALLILHGAVFVYRTLRDAAVVVGGSESARRYLLERERSYQGHEFLALACSPGDKVFISGETRRFYQMTTEAVYEEPGLIRHLERRGLRPEDYLDDQDFRWIWIPEERTDLREHLAGRGYRKAFSYVFTEDPATFRYEILEKETVL